MFKALLVNDDKCQPKFHNIEESQLTYGNVLINVLYSTLNYKDCLALKHGPPVLRKFPIATGIDLAGVVAEGGCSKYKEGDEVLVTGWGIGEKFWGGHSEKAKVDDSWIVSKPGGFSLKNTMECGTAGFTAGLAVRRLIQVLDPKSDKIIVTGASGGVGIISVILLKRLGFYVIASTSREENKNFILNMGANEVIKTESLSQKKLLDQQLWGGGIDTLGGEALVGMCASTKYGGTVLSCGNAKDMSFSGSVAPFILRGICLIGVDSVNQNYDTRRKTWDFLEKNLTSDDLNKISTEVDFNETLLMVEKVINGDIKGRIVLKM